VNIIAIQSFKPPRLNKIQKFNQIDTAVNITAIQYYCKQYYVS